MGSQPVTSQFILRKVRDSNPRYHVMGIPDFESSAFGHSANLPIFQMKMIDIYFSSLSKSNAKVII